MILIWDKTEPPPCNQDGSIYLWNSFQEDFKQNIYSVPRFIEVHAEELRAKYLAYVYDLGQKKYKGKRVVGHLEIRSHFSYWWMTLLAEKSNISKSPLIDEAIKVLALESFLNKHQLEEIALVTANTALVEVLQDWCDNNDVNLNCMNQVVQSKSKKNTLRALYKRMPIRGQAFVWLFRRLVSCWPLAGAGVAKWNESRATTSFVSYFFNLVPSAGEQGKYESRYWGHLPSNMVSEGHPTRWLHIWVQDQVAPSAKIAKQLIDRFNRTEGACQAHVTLDGFLNLSTISSTLIDWMLLQWKARKIENVLGKAQGSTVNLWPLMRNDWIASTKGSIAMSNLLTFNLFEAAFSDIPKQQQGYYLQENQGWEFGCISAWRNAGHNVMTGVPHSTVRYWDLRYFFDPRSYNKTEPLMMPLPNRVAVNGIIAKKNYLEGSYPPNELVEVEALRYNHLNRGKNNNRESQAQEKQQNLLVLGDYLPEYTIQQMKLLEDSAKEINDWVVVIKPHSACPIDLENYPILASINATVTDQPISDLVADCNVAYSSLTTSAAVDAYGAGLPVITIFTPSTLNLSPLRGVDSVQFVSTSEELLLALQKTSQQEQPIHYFYLDSELPRWKKLLGVAE